MRPEACGSGRALGSALHIASPDGRSEHISDTIRPVSARKSRILIRKARDYDPDQPVDEWIRFREAVDEKDRGIVESQRPEELPRDLTAESHIAPDVWSIAFRRRRPALGFGTTQGEGRRKAEGGRTWRASRGSSKACRNASCTSTSKARSSRG